MNCSANECLLQCSTHDGMLVYEDSFMFITMLTPLMSSNNNGSISPMKITYCVNLSIFDVVTVMNKTNASLCECDVRFVCIRCTIIMPPLWATSLCLPWGTSVQYNVGIPYSLAEHVQYCGGKPPLYCGDTIDV